MSQNIAKIGTHTNPSENRNDRSTNDDSQQRNFFNDVREKLLEERILNLFQEQERKLVVCFFLFLSKSHFFDSKGKS